MDPDGWRPDPYGIHEERLFAQGEPTPLVRDDGVGSFDAISTVEVPSEGADGPGRERGEPLGAPVEQSPNRVATPRADGHSSGPRPSKVPAKPWVTAAVSLIAAGVVVGLLGVAGVGRSGGSSTTSTLKPPGHVVLNLPPSTTESPIERALRAQPTTTTESPIERALQALPRSTTTEPTTSAATVPVQTKTPSTSAAVASRPPSSQVSNPSTHPPTTEATSIAAATTLPLTTATTSVGQADEAWYLSYGTVFNTLQTDIEKLNRALASTSPNSYSTLIPYWKELFTDAGQAMTLPSIPGASTQSEWASALGDLSEGASECIIGSVGTSGGGGTAVSFPPIFSQGSAFITTGTTQMDSAAGSVQSSAAATSAASRSQVSVWYQSHGATFTTLQGDITKLNASFGSAGSSGYSTVDPEWQQLMNDAESAFCIAGDPGPVDPGLLDHGASGPHPGLNRLPELVRGAPSQPLRPGRRPDRVGDHLPQHLARSGPEPGGMTTSGLGVVTRT